MPRPCAVRGCPYKNCVPTGGMIHRFPQDEILRKLWIRCSGHEISESTSLENSGVCSFHFKSEQYRILPGSERRGQLFQHACPKLNLPQSSFDGLNVNGSEVMILVEKLELFEITLREHDAMKVEVRMLKKKCKDFEVEKKDNFKKRLDLLKKCDNVEKQLDKFVSQEQQRFLETYREQAAKDFHFLTKNMIDMTIDNNYHKHWKEEDLAFAISIYNSSPLCYNYLREEHNFPFPSRSCVLACMQKINIQPGIIWPVMQVMKHEFSRFTPLQRAAILSFDEMYIDGRISFDEKNEKILGPYKNLMVVTVRSLAYQWKQIIFFAFDFRLTRTKINEIIAELFNVGVDVHGLVSDMSTINRRVWKELSINVDLKDETNSNYSFPHPATNHKIWVFADYPHALKLLRNHFLDNDIKLGPDYGNEVISLKVIRDVMNAQRSSDLQLTHKLTEKHVSMNKKERMNVRTAFELFSGTTAKSILHLFPQHKNMADFFQLVNEGSDLLNVRTKQVHPAISKSPFGTSIVEQTSLIDKLSKNLLELRIQGNRPCLKPFQKFGFKLTIESLKGMFNQLSLPPINMKYLMTSHVNQDHLESTFSVIRGIGGFCDHPLPADAINRVKCVTLSTNMRCPRTGNVHSENGVEFLSSGRLQLLIEGSQKVNNEPIQELEEDYFEEKFRYIRSRVAVRVPVWADEKIKEKSVLGAGEFLAGLISRKFLSECPDMKSLNSRPGWVQILSEDSLITPSTWWLCTFLKFEEYFKAFHKQRRGWDINRDIKIVTPLADYLKTIYPAVPYKAIIFYLKLRTRFRVNAINNKIAVIQRRRKVRQFLAIVEEELEEEDEVEQEADFQIDEMDAEDDELGNIAVDECEDEWELLSI